MESAAIYLLIFGAAINGLGLGVSLAMVRWPLPAAFRVGTRAARWEEFRGRLPLIGLNLFLLYLGSVLFIQLFPFAFSQEIPSLSVMLLQFLVLHLCDDAWFYLVHRGMHQNTWLYNKVHRLHHRAFSPLPIDYIYAHPVEWMAGTIGPSVAFLGIYLVNGGIPMWTMLLYMLQRTGHELWIHSGLKGPLPEVPAVASAGHHAMHHAKPLAGNYASTFSLLDRWLKTEIPGA